MSSKGSFSREALSASRFGALLSLAFLVAPLGCDSDSGDSGDSASTTATDGETGDPPKEQTGAVCPPGGTDLTYADFGEAFMTTYCTTCHSVGLTGTNRNMAPVDHNYDTEADIDMWAMDIDLWAGASDTLTNEYMPPPAGAGVIPFPTLAERKDLAEWLACGSP